VPRGPEDFEGIENRLGRLVAREVLARIRLAAADFDGASEVLHETLARAREGNQQLIVGACLVGLGRIAIERSRFPEAEGHLARAEPSSGSRGTAGSGRSASSSCAPRPGDRADEKAAAVLEDAYRILEELGIRDLVPRYFLLRGRIEEAAGGGSPERARKFYERALVEAREARLPDLAWQTHHRLALLLFARARDPRGGARPGGRGHPGRPVGPAAAGGPGAVPRHPRPDEPPEAGRRHRRRPGGAGGEPPPLPLAGREPPGGAVLEVQALNKKLLRLQEVSQALSSELELNALLERIMDAVLDLVNAERGS